MIPVKYLSELRFIKEEPKGNILTDMRLADLRNKFGLAKLPLQKMTFSEKIHDIHNL